MGTLERHWMFAGKMWPFIVINCKCKLTSFTHNCIHRRAIELVEKNSEPPLRVTLGHMASVMADSKPSCIPLQQKLVTCTMVQIARCQAKKEVYLGKLQEAYAKLCKQRHLNFECETEFVGLCDMLATSGIIALKKSKEARLTKVSI